MYHSRLYKVKQLRRVTWTNVSVYLGNGLVSNDCPQSFPKRTKRLETIALHSQSLGQMDVVVDSQSDFLNDRLKCLKQVMVVLLFAVGHDHANTILPGESLT